MSEALIKLTDQFSETAIDDEVVVMNLESGDFFSLTGTGRAIWLLIDGTRTRAEVVSELALDYGVAEAVIAGEVADFVSELGAAGLIAAA